MTLLLLPLPCPIHVVAVDDGGVVVTLVLKIIFFLGVIVTMTPKKYKVFTQTSTLYTFLYCLHCTTTPPKYPFVGF